MKIFSFYSQLILPTLVLAMLLLLTISAFACSGTGTTPTSTFSFPTRPTENTATNPAPTPEPIPTPTDIPSPTTPTQNIVPTKSTTPTSKAEAKLTIKSAGAIIQIAGSDYASYTYTVSGEVSGLDGSIFLMSAVIIDPKIGEVPLTGPQDATGGWSYTKDPNYKSVRFEKKAGEPDSMTWTITGSGKEGASYAFPGCTIEFRAILRLNGVNIQRQNIQVKAS
ncbi:MAG: hypothetical protein V1767_08670 [Chloroflexota bacterium]